jgi:hypothetical protein
MILFGRTPTGTCESKIPGAQKNYKNHTGTCTSDSHLLPCRCSSAFVPIYPYPNHILFYRQYYTPPKHSGHALYVKHKLVKSTLPLTTSSTTTPEYHPIAGKPGSKQ